MGVLKYILFALALFASPVSAADIFITQSGTVGDTGNDCDNAHSAAWFNANAAGGNTYHLCGTFTGTAGSTMLTVPTGSEGNILTVLFEPNAVLTAPYWGGTYDGAINVSEKTYVTIDGGTNGVIKNSANGTTLSYHQASQGIYVSSSSHIEIKNLIIQDIYANGGVDPDCKDTAGSETNNIFVNGSNDNISIHHNTLTAARAGVRVGFRTNYQIDIHHNTISDYAWGIVMGGASGVAGDTCTNTTIHDNDIGDCLNWQYPQDKYHANGIIVWAAAGGPVFTPAIYNNYIHGDVGASSTGYIYCTHGGGTGDTSTSCTIYNNLIVNEGTNNTWLVATGSSTSDHKIYNNTLIGHSSAGGIAMMLSGTGIELKNNIVSNARIGVGTYATITDVVAVSDNNVWHNISSGPTSSMFSSSGPTWYNWLQWQALGFDLNSYYENPNLTASYHLQPTSGNAIDHGATLDAAYNTDYDGNARGSGAAWDIGAYEYRTVPNMSNFGTGAITITPNNSGAITITPY
jgi:hypothetical protein